MPIALPLIPAPAAKAHAAWPVWSGSTAKTIDFQPMPRKAAGRLYHRARQFDRLTKKGNGKHGGQVGPAALKVLETLLYDFLNFATGRLDPSYAAIARKANLGVRAVATAIARLRDLGILRWARRCAVSWADGRSLLKQQTNAYAVRPESEWEGYVPPPEAPKPLPGTWGNPAPMPSVLEAAAGARGDTRTMIRILDTAPANGLEAALAKYGHGVQERGNEGSPRSAREA